MLRAAPGRRRGGVRAVSARGPREVAIVRRQLARGRAHHVRQPLARPASDVAADDVPGSASRVTPAGRTARGGHRRGQDAPLVARRRPSYARPMREPWRTSAAFAEAICAGDLEAASACWLPDAVMVGIDGTTARGSEALRAAFARLIAAGTHMAIEVTDQVTGPAVALAATRVAIAPSASATPMRASGRVVYLATETGWRIAIDRVRDA